MVKKRKFKKYIVSDISPLYISSSLGSVCATKKTKAAELEKKDEGFPREDNRMLRKQFYS